MISCSCHLVPDGHILHLPVTMLFRHVCSLHMDGKMFGQNLMFIIVLCGGCHPSQSNLKFTIVFFGLTLSDSHFFPILIRCVPVNLKHIHRFEMDTQLLLYIGSATMNILLQYH